MISVDDAKKHPEVWLEQNKGLLQKAISKFDLESPKFSREDLFQEAYIVGLKAIERYDEGSTAKLSTYVFKAVSRACCDFVRKNKFDLYVTPYQQNKQWKKTRDKSQDDKSCSPQPLFGTVQSPTAIRIDETSNKTGESLGDTIPSGELSVLNNLIKKEQVVILREELNKLPEREKDILYARYWNGASLEKIASQQGCSRQRINIISKRALDRLASKVKRRLEDELFI